jgi:hypothetical protein
MARNLKRLPYSKNIFFFVLRNIFVLYKNLYIYTKKLKNYYVFLYIMSNEYLNVNLHKHIWEC